MSESPTCFVGVHYSGINTALISSTKKRNLGRYVTLSKRFTDTKDDWFQQGYYEWKKGEQKREYFITALEINLVYGWFYKVVSIKKGMPSRVCNYYEEASTRSQKLTIACLFSWKWRLLRSGLIRRYQIFQA
jgi:hypothetical protein